MFNISRKVDQGQFSVLLRPTTLTLSLSYTIIAIAIILNSLEIKLIVRKIKRATDFEIVLLNLAIADLLNSFLLTSITVITQKAKDQKFLRTGNTIHWVMGVLSFSMTASVTFVIIIGLERFFAIKLPLQHRLWHTSRRRLIKYTIFTWLFDVILITSIMVIDYLIMGDDPYKVSPSMMYFLAGLLTFGLALILVLYTWVLYLMIIRSIKLFDFDKNILRINPKMIKDAMKKERSSIIICTLVVLSFMACDIPLVIDLFQFKVTMAAAIMLKASAVMNPLIYFFKGHLEKYFAKQKLVSSSREVEAPKDGKKEDHRVIEVIEKGRGLNGQSTISTNDVIANPAADRGEVDNNGITIEIENRSKNCEVPNDSLK